MVRDSSKRLHSRYDPVKEAQRFVEAHQCNFQPYVIFLTEPGESFLAPILRATYPLTKIVALRYDSCLFKDTDYLWDSVWRPDTGLSLDAFLFNEIPDEYLHLSLFWAWKPSDEIWPDVADRVWSSISGMIKNQVSVMQTRAHFGPRWFKNMLNNVIRGATFVTLATSNNPIILAAAGPSLESLKPFNCSSYRLFSVSSALSSLHHHGFKPDLCISTDGGFWAATLFRHLDPAIPVAFSLESAIPSAVLERNPLVLLSYGSALEKKIISLMHITTSGARRNGTVAGTAAEFALEQTTASVYAAGLDLEHTAGFSHARPHVSLDRLECLTNRVHPLSTIVYATSLDTRALDTYATWFASRSDKFKSRFYRLKPEGRTLDGIKSVSQCEIVCDRPVDEKFVITTVSLSRQERKRIIIAWINDVLCVFSAFIHFPSSCDIDSFFIEKILQQEEYLEILQMLSFMDYLKVVKLIRQTERGNSTHDKVAEISEKIVHTLTQIRETVERYEL